MIKEIRHINDQTAIGIWEINQTLDQLSAQIHTNKDLSRFHPKKKEEFLASRILIREIREQMNLPELDIEKDDHGKPHFIGSDVQLSISHSHPIISCMVHRCQPCGIDIESPRAQLLNIRRKFLAAHEYEYCGDDLDRLCLYWAAKEAIFKIFGRKYLSFSRDILIQGPTGQELSVDVTHAGIHDQVVLSFEKVGNYYLVYGNL